MPFRRIRQDARMKCVRTVRGTIENQGSLAVYTELHCCGI